LSPSPLSLHPSVLLFLQVLFILLCSFFLLILFLLLALFILHVLFNLVFSIEYEWRNVGVLATRTHAGNAYCTWLMDKVLGKYILAELFQLLHVQGDKHSQKVVFAI
jgi:hypothetical protein